MKLLVNNPAGDQEIIEIGDGGAYFDPDRVLWDERQDGLIDPYPLTLGGMVRVNDDEGGSSLAFDQELFDARPAPEAPTVCTMAQARKALLTAGITATQVEAALADNPMALIDWEFQTEVRRSSTLVQSVGAALGVSVDDLFRLAVTL